MQLLKEIFDQPIGDDKFTTREAVRAVIFDENELIPILYVSKYKYHKLPGGWIESGENMQEALAREVREEAGCDAIIGQEVWKIVEYRSQWKFLQTSYCYLWRVSKKFNPEFTDKELEEGFQLQWMSLDDAIITVRSDKPENYAGQSHQPRDLAFLEKAREILNSK